MKKKIVRVLLVLVLGLVSFAGWYGWEAAPLGVGYAAKFICTQHFVSGQDVAETLDEEVRSVVVPIGGLIDVDVTDDTVTTSLFGRVTARAVHRPGLGCTMFLPSSAPAAPLVVGTSSGGIELGAPEPRCFDAAALKEAVDGGFAEPPGGGRRTKAIVVVHEGRLAAERYGEGWTKDTPLLGWSMSKSVTATLVGILVRQGRLSLEDRPFSSASDPRNAMMLDHLVRMTTGLAFAETHTGVDPVSHMLFEQADMAAFVRQAKLKDRPGEKFEYTSGATLVVSRMIRDAVGGSLEGQLRLLQEELAEPLGLRRVVFESDASGTLVGSSYMLATARDWAKLGVLWANEGEVNGRRIVTKEWMAASVQPTGGLDEPAAYGRSFWLNTTGPGSERPWPALPADAYSARGFQGQYVIVVPSKSLVIVRLGTSTGHGAAGVEALATGVLRALRGCASG